MVAAFHGQCHDDRCAAIFIVDALSLSLSLSCLFLFLYFSFGMRRFLCDVEGRRHRVSFSFDTRRSASPWISWRRTRLRSLVDWFTAFWFALPSFGAFATDSAVCHESPELPGFYRVFTAVSSLQLEWPRLLPSFTGFCRTAQACVSKLPGFFPTEFSCLKWWWKKKWEEKRSIFIGRPIWMGFFFFPVSECRGRSLSSLGLVGCAILHFLFVTCDPERRSGDVNARNEPRYHRFFPSLLSLHLVLHSFTAFYLVLLGFTGFYLVLLGFT